MVCLVLGKQVIGINIANVYDNYQKWFVTFWINKLDGKRN